MIYDFGTFDGAILRAWLLCRCFGTILGDEADLRPPGEGERRYPPSLQRQLIYANFRCFRCGASRRAIGLCCPFCKGDMLLRLARQSLLLRVSARLGAPSPPLVAGLFLPGPWGLFVFFSFVFPSRGFNWDRSFCGSATLAQAINWRSQFASCLTKSRRPENLLRVRKASPVRLFC